MIKKRSLGENRVFTYGSVLLASKTWLPKDKRTFPAAQATYFLSREGHVLHAGVMPREEGKPP